MQYWVHTRLAAAKRPTTAGEGRILLNSSCCRPWQAAKNLWRRRRLAGGPVSSTIAIVLIVEVESVPELDHVLTGLAAWPQMETEVTPPATLRRAETVAAFPTCGVKGTGAGIGNFGSGQAMNARIVGQRSKQFG